MKRFAGWLLVLVICLAIAGGLGLFKFMQIRAAIAFAQSFPESSEAVEAVYAEAVTRRPVVSAVGEVVPVRSVELRTELAGRITEVGFSPGARVTAGQVLVRLDTREEEARLAAAEAQAELAGIILARNESLTATSAVSKQAADTARAERDAAVATANRLRTIIDKMTLRAPFEAIAGLHELQPGQFLEAGTTVTRLVGVSEEVWIDFSLPQEESDLRIGDTVSVKAVRRRDESAEARVIARDPFVDRGSRNVRFRAVVPNEPGSLEPGAIVTVSVPVGAEATLLRIPATAVRRDAFGTSVFVLVPAEAGADAAERAERRAVEVDRIDAGHAFIRSGIAAGEKIATDGSFKLRDGILVNSRPAVEEP
ncbi:MAG: efflux RND transporter periplasmic adaptor subunit [Gammaproteobacteria bacterium]